MVTGDFVPFFTTMAGVGATLFGLIFLVISIRPEVAHTETTSVMRQVQVSSSYSALLNPLVISLIALLPHATIDTITIIMSAIGLVNTLIMGVVLLRDTRNWRKKLANIPLILVGLVMFGFEILYAIRLDIAPGDSSALYNLSILLVLIYLYGISRAWDLIGVRHFHVQDVWSPLAPKERRNASSDELH